MAVPVASERFNNEIQGLVDEFVCLNLQADSEGVRMVKNNFEEFDLERYLPIGRDEEQLRDR